MSNTSHEDPTEWMREELLHMADAIEEAIADRVDQQVKELLDHKRWLTAYAVRHPDAKIWVSQEIGGIMLQIDKLRGRGSPEKRAPEYRPDLARKAALKGGR